MGVGHVGPAGQGEVGEDLDEGLRPLPSRETGRWDQRGGAPREAGRPPWGGESPGGCVTGTESPQTGGDPRG